MILQWIFAIQCFTYWPEPKRLFILYMGFLWNTLFFFFSFFTPNLSTYTSMVMKVASCLICYINLDISTLVFTNPVVFEIVQLLSLLKEWKLNNSIQGMMIDEHICRIVTIEYNFLLFEKFYIYYFIFR